MFGPGDMMTDMMVATHRRAAEHASRHAQINQGNVDYLKGELQKCEEDNAANLAHRYALHEQLKRFDPTNPLLVDKMLVERLHNAAISAFVIAQNSPDAAREVGRTFAIPSSEKRLASAPKLMTGSNTSEDTQIRLVLQKELALSELRRHGPDSVLFNSYLLDQILKEGLALYKEHTAKSGQAMPLEFVRATMQSVAAKYRRFEGATPNSSPKES